ncbi:MAG: UDP-N-acetylmuramate--L-alanine ligase [Alphaproteobacteria bacterium MarineAlpha5_Bin8]|nr:MAG: UDP-N-acetylmuramate--L-alanine ligase [Alphaproteobacteria bacterium MarineAlpha5_Bin7]PPR48238.1 MAG: UDP-N-acetylmuramate--L-alanine ligase [Alphaproteobacteria bacterium MarineAlpha5_Bin8]PPR54458.1 MAG: UDP-N-acetylmuramate--L-alanine ligase [Alphaproteobacteria bacterium MarineAlpha5_Bin6]|tara:strand:+ start:227 stop:1654 length:1428 start_codon:yes stop_codon:yes gene_type:complete
MKSKVKKSNIIIHFIGIGGIGMSGIAELMLDQGFLIQGSDISLNDNIKRLKKKGAKIFLKHDKRNIKNISAAVFSSAIKKNNIEIIECNKLSIPLVSRASMLAELMRNKNSIAIAGSHGKTTTTSLVGMMLESSKLDPTIINGGVINAYSKNNKLGLGKWMVVEADESDGSFLKLPHEINIITNIDSEHLDYYQTNAKLIESFYQFINNIPFYGYSIICTDNLNTYKLSKKINTRKIITYSQIRKESDVKIVNIKNEKIKTFFSIIIKKNVLKKFSGIYSFETNILGKHNVSNVTGAIIASLLAGASINSIKKSLKHFKGVKRRFTYLGKINKASIYDDYAHHPTEIKASYDIAKILTTKKIIVIFQPHRYSRTYQLYNSFVKILKKIDILYILDIYSAGEKPIKNISSKKLVRDLNKIRNKKALLIGNNVKINKLLTPYYKEENIIIFMGAGSITHQGYKLIEENHAQKNSRNI